jgi:hypothetical protein
MLLIFRIIQIPVVYNIATSKPVEITVSVLVLLSHFIKGPQKEAAFEMSLRLAPQLFPKVV